jgi:hypothetical protein
VAEAVRLNKKGVLGNEDALYLSIDCGQKIIFKAKFMFLGPPCAMTGLPEATSDVLSIVKPLPNVLFGK